MFSQLLQIASVSSSQTNTCTHYNLTPHHKTALSFFPRTFSNAKVLHPLPNCLFRTVLLLFNSVCIYANTHAQCTSVSYPVDLVLSPMPHETCSHISSLGDAAKSFRNLGKVLWVWGSAQVRLNPKPLKRSNHFVLNGEGGKERITAKKTTIHRKAGIGGMTLYLIPHTSDFRHVWIMLWTLAEFCSHEGQFCLHKLYAALNTVAKKQAPSTRLTATSNSVRP